MLGFVLGLLLFAALTWAAGRQFLELWSSRQSEKEARDGLNRAREE
jgi:hypothetical protein